MAKVIWLTGLPGAGKSTIGTELLGILKQKSDPVVMLDGDQLREIFNNKQYDRAGRLNIARSYGKLCQHLASSGVNIIMCTVSLFKEVHQWNRENIQDYKEVFLDIPQEVLEARNQKGLYSGAQDGDVKNVHGYDLAYDRPENPDLVIVNSDNEGPKEIADSIGKQLGL